MDITCIGTKGINDSKHEGISGWTIEKFFSDVDSPFVFNGVFDFSKYMLKNEFSELDYVFINLGINDLFGYVDDISLYEKIKIMLIQYNKVIESIHEYDQNIKIGISITIPSAYDQDSFGKAYGCGQTRLRYKRNNFIWMKYLIDEFDNRFDENIYLVPINVSLDTRYNMGIEEMQVNSRNTAKIRTISTNGNVHPSESGYWQIADCYWYFLKKFRKIGHMCHVLFVWCKVKKEIIMEFRDLKSQYKKYKNKIDDAITNVMADCNFISGKQVRELEKQLANYVGVKHCITCGNGTDALTLMMMAWNIKEGDAVFVPDFTFFASGEVVSFEGAMPVFVDVNKNTFNIDTDKLEFAIQKIIAEDKYRPRAIISVDLFGLTADYIEIEKIAKKYNLLLLEDAAQGFGGRIKDRKACSFGDAATTSFFPAKPLGCYGDGGAIFTNDDNLERTLRSLCVHGKGEDKYDNVRIGINSRLDTIQAAILNIKLKAFIEHELDDVNRIYKMYNDRLANIVKTPYIPDGYYSSFAQYTIKLKNEEQRDGLQAYLKENNVPSMIYYVKPMHKQKAFSKYELNDENFPVTNELCSCVLSLPMHPYLTLEDVDLVCECVKLYLRNNF